MLARIGDRSLHGHPARRRTAWTIGAAAAAALALSGCGSSASTASTSSGSASGANVAAAKAAIAPLTGHPSGFPVTTALSKPLPAGARFVFLQCSTTVCGLVAQELKPAVAAIGGSLTNVNAGATAATSQAAAASVLALKPNVVFLRGLEPSLFAGGLKALSAAGITVVSISISKDVKPYGITFNYIGQQFTDEEGKLLADWVIAREGDHADVIFYGVPAIDFSNPMQQAFEDEMKKNCPSCKVRTVPIDVTTLGTTSAQTVVTSLQSHPDVNTAVFASYEVADGLPAALKAADLTVTTLGYGPNPENLQDIKSGGLTAGLAVDFPVSVWAAVDSAARLLEGGQPTQSEIAGDVPSQFLTQSDITFDPARGWSAYPDYAQRFTQLWHVGS